MKNNNAVLIRKKYIDDMLIENPVEGKRLLEPLKTFAAERQLPFNILENREISNAPEIHMHEADLWHCLEGEVKFVCGGEMISPHFQKNPDGTENKNEITGKEIKEGEEVTLHSGDWLYIKAGEVHQHGSKGTARMIIIKIPKK